MTLMFLVIHFKIIFHIISHYLVSVDLLNCRFYPLSIHITPLHSYNILPPPPYLTLSPPTKSFPLPPQHSCNILFQLSTHIVTPYYLYLSFPQHLCNILSPLPALENQLNSIKFSIKKPVFFKFFALV